jgi:hypothetical protein
MFHSVNCVTKGLELISKCWLCNWHVKSVCKCVCCVTDWLQRISACLLCNRLITAYFSVFVVLHTDYSVVSDCPGSEGNSEMTAVMLMQSGKRSNNGRYMCSGNVHPVVQENHYSRCKPIPAAFKWYELIYELIFAGGIDWFVYLFAYGSTKHLFRPCTKCSF